jgi:hypothetical protein
MARPVSYILSYVLAPVMVSSAHPGHDHQREAAKRLDYLKHPTRSPTHYASQLKS